MRRLLALLAFAPLLVPASAHADLLDGCQTFADMPSAPHAFYTEAHGGITCDPAAPDLEVTVCLEVLDASGWVPISCGGGFDPGPASYVDAYASGCWWGIYVYRSTAIGKTGDGRGGFAFSPPVVYFCTPL